MGGMLQAFLFGLAMIVIGIIYGKVLLVLAASILVTGTVTAYVFARKRGWF
jgi:hypothetical protein